MTQRILVVDDLPDWRKTLGGLLTDEGYAVDVAGSADEALSLMEEKPFDLAVLDIRLDETDEENVEGLDLGTQIQERWPETSIIFSTGYGTQEIIARAMQPNASGKSLAVDYVPKTEAEELVTQVRRAISC
jgi:DNA-binding NtrC family response regulator